VKNLGQDEHDKKPDKQDKGVILFIML